MYDLHDLHMFVRWDLYNLRDLCMFRMVGSEFIYIELMHNISLSAKMHLGDLGDACSVRGVKCSTCRSPWNMGPPRRGAYPTKALFIVFPSKFPN